MFCIFCQFLILITSLLYQQELKGNSERSVHKTLDKQSNINNDWKEIKPYLIPNNHPIKKRLDAIFSQSRVLADWDSLMAAGFSALPPQPNTQIIVAKHPDLPGYVIKTYLDTQAYFRNRPEDYHWIRRIRGARLIQKYLKKYRYRNLLKVPKKWIYLLPTHPSFPQHQLQKKTLLIAEDMEIFDEKTNEALWGSEQVTTELLDALYKITTDLGLRDSAKPSNCSFSKDGKAAFVDTEIYHRNGVRYDKLTPHLSPTMRAYWEEMTGKSSQMEVMR